MKQGTRGLVTAFQDHPVHYMCFPIVQFADEKKQLKTVGYHRFPPRCGPESTCWASCDRLPLVEAFAVNISKIQGAEMDQIVADSFRCELRWPGQAYTVLGRLTSLSGLFLAEYNPVATHCF